MTNLVTPIGRSDVDNSPSIADLHRLHIAVRSGHHEFANPRGVAVRVTGGLADALRPPYGPVAQAIVNSVFDSAGQPSDPTA